MAQSPMRESMKEKGQYGHTHKSNKKVVVVIGMTYVYKPTNPKDCWQLSEARREAWDVSSSKPPERTNQHLAFGLPNS